MIYADYMIIIIKSELGVYKVLSCDAKVGHLLYAEGLKYKTFVYFLNNYVNCVHW